MPLIWLVACLVVCFSCLVACEEDVASCTFTKRDLPVPEHSLIIGDPRKKEECKKTSFEATRPANLFDPAGVRLWTREEDTMAKSEDPFVKKMFEEEVGLDPYPYSRFNRPVVESRRNGLEIKFQLLKNLKAGSTMMVQTFGARLCVFF